MELVKIVCTCVPGFESVTIKECHEKFDIKARSDFRGRVSLPIEICNIARILELRSVSHFWVVVSEIPDFFSEFTTKEKNEELFAYLKHLPEEITWDNALKTWKSFKSDAYYKSLQFKTNDENEAKVNGHMKGDEIDIVDLKVIKEEKEYKSLENKFKKLTLTNYSDIDPLSAGEKVSFRVTANRTGKHVFTSVETAVHFGAGVNEFMGWKVDLSNYDIEVVLHAVEKDLSIGIQLTTENQSHRNIRHFGPTTLKANISYSLLQFAQVQPGDVVCDPMCGSGSISLEGALSCPNMFHLAGENHPVAVEHAGENIEGMESERGKKFSLPVSVVQWDIYQLPLRTSSVDRIVSDLPFGKKIGSKDRNMFLYPVALKEMGRVCRPDGLAVLLTQHKGALTNALKKVNLWKQVEIRKIYMGGMNLVVFLLRRTHEKSIKKVPEKFPQFKENLNGEDPS